MSASFLTSLSRVFRKGSEASSLPSQPENAAEDFHRVDFAALCDVGLVRSVNQDNVCVNSRFREDPYDNSPFSLCGESVDGGVFAVCDGMGGERYGELASLIAVKTLAALPPSAGITQVLASVAQANEDICSLITEKGGARIGTTLVALVLRSDSARVVNIGDSRAYLLRDGDLKRLSCDHTAAGRLAEMGVITAEAAENHPDRHRLIQHLGIFPTEMLIQPYASPELDLQAGDLYLLCSDGLTEMVPDAKIAGILKGDDTPQRKAESLLALAKEAGGRDNISIIIAKLT